MNKSGTSYRLYHHNVVEMQLNRLPMTPRFPVSSKDDSSIDACSTLSSEDDCNIMVFTWVLDLDYECHMDICVGELLNP